LLKVVYTEVTPGYMESLRRCADAYLRRSAPMVGEFYNLNKRMRRWKKNICRNGPTGLMGRMWWRSCTSCRAHCNVGASAGSCRFRGWRRGCITGSRISL